MNPEPPSWLCFWLVTVPIIIILLATAIIYAVSRQVAAGGDTPGPPRAVQAPRDPLKPDDFIEELSLMDSHDLPLDSEWISHECDIGDHYRCWSEEDCTCACHEDDY